MTNDENTRLFDKTETTQGDPEARVGAVVTDAAGQQKYVIRYDGNLVPEEPDTATGEAKRITIGPHAFVLLRPDVNVAINVTATYNPTTTGIPDITITISQ